MTLNLTAPCLAPLGPMSGYHLHRLACEMFDAVCNSSVDGFDQTRIPVLADDIATRFLDLTLKDPVLRSRWAKLSKLQQQHVSLCILQSYSSLHMQCKLDDSHAFRAIQLRDLPKPLPTRANTAAPVNGIPPHCRPDGVFAPENGLEPGVYLLAVLSNAQRFELLKAFHREYHTSWRGDIDEFINAVSSRDFLPHQFIDDYILACWHEATEGERRHALGYVIKRAGDVRYAAFVSRRFCQLLGDTKYECQQARHSEAHSWATEVCSQLTGGDLPVSGIDTFRCATLDHEDANGATCSSTQQLQSQVSNGACGGSTQQHQPRALSLNANGAISSSTQQFKPPAIFPNANSAFGGSTQKQQSQDSNEAFGGSTQQHQPPALSPNANGAIGSSTQQLQPPANFLNANSVFGGSAQKQQPSALSHNVGPIGGSTHQHQQKPALLAKCDVNALRDAIGVVRLGPKYITDATKPAPKAQVRASKVKGKSNAKKGKASADGEEDEDCDEGCDRATNARPSKGKSKSNQKQTNKDNGKSKSKKGKGRRKSDEDSAESGESEEDCSEDCGEVCSDDCSDTPESDPFPPVNPHHPVWQNDWVVVPPRLQEWRAWFEQHENPAHMEQWGDIYSVLYKGCYYCDPYFLGVGDRPSSHLIMPHHAGFLVRSTHCISTVFSTLNMHVLK